MRAAIVPRTTAGQSSDSCWARENTCTHRSTPICTVHGHKLGSCWKRSGRPTRPSREWPYNASPFEMIFVDLEHDIRFGEALQAREHGNNEVPGQKM